MVKRLRFDYAQKHQLHAGERFTNRDVARELATTYLRTHQDDLPTYLRKVLAIPFVRDELPSEELELLHQARDHGVKGLIEPKDLGKMQQEDFIQSIEERLRAQATTRAQEEVLAERTELEDLRKQVESDRAELARYKSDLDSIDSKSKIEDLSRGLSAVQAPSKVEKDQKLWWKTLGLTANPFPTYTGLDKIPADKFDDVIVQTRFFKDYVQDVVRDPTTLVGKTVLISGEFGSGKTTLLQYLSATAGRSGMIPVDIDFVTYDQAESLTRDLLVRICDELSALYQARFGEDPRRVELSTDPALLARELFLSLQKGPQEGGFVVSIDGLHKGSLESKSIFTFLQQLQNLQENLTHKGVRVGFIVAGSPLWDREIAQSPSLSGSFHSREVIPPLEEDSAVKAVEQRIRAFSTNSALTPSVNLDDLRRAYQILSQRIQRPLTFRDFLKHIGSRLEAGAFTEAGIQVAMHVETVEAVQAIFAQADGGRRLGELLAEVGDVGAMREAVRDALLKMLESGGVSEHGPVYLSLRPAFFLLRKFRLISQRKATGAMAFEWTLSPQLKSLVAETGRRLSVSARTVLTAALEEASTARRGESGVVYEAAKQELNSLLPAWRDQWPALVDPLERCRKLLTEIDDHTRVANWRSVTAAQFTGSVEALVSALNIVGAPDVRDPELAWTTYAGSWFAPENASQILAFAPSNFALPTTETTYFGVLHEHNEVIGQLVRDLREFLQGESICRLAGRRLTHDELSTIQRLRRSFAQFSYREVIDGAAELLESRIRGNCYVALRCAWGDGAADRIPATVRANIERLPERGHHRARRDNDVNFFFDMSRSEYSQVIFETNIFRVLFGDSMRANEKAKLKDGIELTFALDDRNAHRDRATYFKEKATEIGTCLGTLPAMLEAFHSVTMRILSGTEVTYVHLGIDYIEGTFLFEGKLNPAPRSVKVPTNEAIGLRATLLRRCEGAPIITQDLTGLCLSSGAQPEHQLLVLRGLVKLGFLSVSDSLNSPPTITITEKGLATARKN